MANAPRNHRTKQPRSLRSRQLQGPQSMRHAYRYGSAITPTPPPVAVSVPTAAAEPEAPAAQPPVRKSGTSAWWWFAMSALVCAASAALWRHVEPSEWLSHHLEPIKMAKQDPPTAALLMPTAPVAAPAAPSNRWQVRHDGPIPIEGGTLMVPKSFTTRQGDHDLILHFHGDAELVRQSVAYAKINAAVAVLNLGEGAQPYMAAFQQAGAFEKLLDQIRQGLIRRGVQEPRLRRLGLTSWGVGYGAIASILEHRRAPHAGADPLDAIVVLDGLRCGFMDGDRRRLNERSILPFVRAAEAAADEQLMFGITHSRLRATDYASSERTAALILDQVGVERSSGPTLRIPDLVPLRASAKASKSLPRLLPVHDTRVGSLRVQGFDGDTPAHHAAHLAQMASVGLADLATRWSRERPPRRTAPDDDETEPPADEAASEADEAASDATSDSDEAAGDADEATVDSAEAEADEPAADETDKSASEADKTAAE